MGEIAQTTACHAAALNRPVPRGEIQIAVHALDRMLALGRPESVRAA
ncbi:hypothetical protein [Azospirillum argentinense]